MAAPGVEETATSEEGHYPPARRRGAQYPARPTEDVADILRKAGSVAWAVVGIAVALAVLFYVGSRIAVVFPPLVLAGMIVFLLNPFVTWLHRRGVPRAAGAGFAYLIFFAIVTLVVILAVPALAWAAPHGTVVAAQGVDPTTLDPQNHQETPAANLAVNMFDFLLERDQDLKIVPMLAESYKNVAPTVWEFRLRKGVKFHNGEEFNA
ncbi:MAG: ABC transporter substrate-binding protein, partial [Actinomycetota bacterium]